MAGSEPQQTLELSYGEARLIDLGLLDASQDTEDMALRAAMRTFQKRMVAEFEELWDFDQDPNRTRELDVNGAELDMIDTALGALEQYDDTDSVMAAQLREALKSIR